VHPAIIYVSARGHEAWPGAGFGLMECSAARSGDTEGGTENHLTQQKGAP